MTFGTPFWLLGALLLAASLAGLWRWSGRRAQALLRNAFDTPLLARLLQSVDPRRRRWKRLLLATGLVALAVALARPQWGRKEIELERTGVDLVIALDVSRSMLAADAGQTNRLTTASGAIRQLLDSLGGDRVALVVFAGEAFLASPLTRDHVAVDRALETAGPEVVSKQGSDLGAAIKRAKECFDRAAQGPRALLVVSDGEQLQGDAVGAARAAAREGIRVHTAGVGSLLGARVPRRGGELGAFTRNAMGREVVTWRDEQRLQQIAEAGGGLYTRLDGPDSTALKSWFQQASSALPRSTEKRLVNEPRERFQWPLAVALTLLAAEWMLGERKRPRAGSTKTST